MTIRMFPSKGGQISVNVPPPPAPPQRAYSAGQSMSVVTTASTTTSTLEFGANNVPPSIEVGLQVLDQTTPGAISGGQVVQSFNIVAGTVTLSGNVNAEVNSGDTIVFWAPFIDVPGDATGDAAAIGSRGFVGIGTSGPTSARPANPKGGDWHVDTTLGYAVVSDGSSWRNPISGVAV